MAISIIKLKAETRTCYSLNGAKTVDDFKQIANILQNNFNVTLLEKLGAIWVYAEKYDYQGKKFLFGLDDDLDCYFEAVDKQNPSENEDWLSNLVESLISEVNKVR
jgi:hypothetical protein